MSDTIVDMAKVTQLLDAGWSVRLYRGGLGSYVAVASHENPAVMERAERIWSERYPDAMASCVDDDGEIVTDDFTPQQCLTRLAYKVHGEII